MKRIALVSDTHDLLRDEVLAGLAGVERILHMGDFCGAGILARLEEIAPVTGVRGNCDFGAWAARLPRTDVVEAFGTSAYLVHDIDHLDVDPAAAGLGFVFYGHSHRPTEETRGGVRFVNPGSVGPRRFDLPISWAFWHEDGTIEFISLPF